MTVDELIERLEEISDGEGLGSAEVLIAIQPTWPLQSNLRGVAISTELPGDAEGEIEEDQDDQDEEPAVVWLVEGAQCEHPYAPRGVFEAAQ